MFAENQKISARQLKRMILIDWASKAGLLLAIFSGTMDSSQYLTAFLLGAAFLMVYGVLTCWVAKHVENSFYAYSWYRLGRVGAVILCLLYWLYLFINLVYLFKLAVSVGTTFLLPEQSETGLLLLFGAVALYGAWDGLEERARHFEILYPFLVLPVVLLLFYTACTVKEPDITRLHAVFHVSSVCLAARIAAVFGGSGIYLFLIPEIADKKNAEKAFGKGIAMTMAGNLFLFLTIRKAFGEQGTKALSWPFLTVLTGTKHFDVLFFALFLGCILMAMSADISYLGFLTEELISAKWRKRGMCIGGISAAMAALACTSYAMSVQLYAVVNSYLLFPIMVFFTILLALIEYFAGKKKKRSFSALLLVLFLTGCGRELEDCRFPTILTTKELETEAEDTDFGQVQYILLTQAQAKEEMARELLYELETRPEISRDCLVFQAEYDILEAFGKEDVLKEDALEEDVWKKEGEITFGELLYCLHNEKCIPEIPKLKQAE